TYLEPESGTWQVLKCWIGCQALQVTKRASYFPRDRDSGKVEDRSQAPLGTVIRGAGTKAIGVTVPWAQQRAQPLLRVRGCRTCVSPRSRVVDLNLDLKPVLVGGVVVPGEPNLRWAEL